MHRVEQILESRRRVAHHYMDRLMTSKFITLPTLTAEDVMSWFVFVVKLGDLFQAGDRDTAIHMLREQGIGCNNYFPPIHLQPYMVEQFGYKAGDFPVTEYVAGRTIALPFFSKMTARQVDRVCQVLEKTLEKLLVSRKGRF
jgi:perosamine synthetase